jgi:hypothetical protein
MWLRLIADAIDLVTTRRGRWFPFEQQMLDRLVSQLPETSGQVMKQQLSLVRSIVRGPGYREVYIYFKRGGNTNVDHVPMFVDQSEQVLLATGKLKRDNSKSVLRADFWLVHGRLFEIAYGKSPRQFFKTRNLDSAHLSSVDIVIQSDPMINSAVMLRKSDSHISQFEAEALLNSLNVKNLQIPYSRETIERELAKFDAVFPTDYIDFMTRSDGCVVDGCEVLGLTKIRQVVFENANYHILAEIEGRGVLAVEGRPSSGNLCMIDYVDETVISMGTRFLPALLEFRQLEASK